MIYAVNGFPTVCSVSGSCCEIKENLMFPLNTMSGVYNITNFCGICKLTVQGYCDAYSDGGG